MSRPDEELPLSRQKPVRDDVRREVEDHLASRVEELVRQGHTADAARSAALTAFGDVDRVAAECRAISTRTRRHRHRSARWDLFRSDIRFGARQLRRSPGFAIVAVITLALGIGANTAIFSVINRLLLRPLPYDHPDRIVDIVELHQHGYGNVPWTNYLDLRTQTHSFDAMAKYYAAPATMIAEHQPMRVTAAAVSNGFFRVMRAGAALGRVPGPTDHRLGAIPVAVVSQRFWREHLGASTRLDTIQVRGEFNFQVIGVLPAGFSFPQDADVWYPLELEEQATSRTAHNGLTIGRLKPGITAAAATEDLDLDFHRISTTAGLDFDAVGSRVTSLQADLTGSARKPLLLLLSAAVLLLLIACTNLASTLLARGTARAQELAVRTAIGAGRGRLIRQIFTESLIIAVLGGAAGMLLAFALVRGLVALAPPGLALPGDTRLDARVLAFTAGVSIVTAILFGLLPAIRVTDGDTAQLIRASGRGSAQSTRGVWSTLIGFEVALAVILLVGSGLLLRSFAAVLSVNLGFAPQQVLTAEIDLPQLNYTDPLQAVAFHDRLLATLRTVPGIVDAGVTNVLPLDGDGPDGGVQVEGKPPVSPVRPSTGVATYRIASTGYFAAMGMPITRGRDFTESDAATSPSVVIVNQAFARREWPSDNPIGKRIRPVGMDAVTPELATVIGVVHDVPDAAITAPAKPAYYYSYRQLPYRASWLALAIRTSGPPETMVNAVRDAVRRTDPLVAVGFETMAHRVSLSIADRRFVMLLLGAFAVTALLLATVGIFGVVAYSVTQRVREIGIRIALGATPVQVRRAVQVQTVAIVAAGVGAGWIGAVLATRVLQSQLFGIGRIDPLSFGGVAVVLLGAAWIASWIPARRGTRVDPMTAIRAD